MKQKGNKKIVSIVTLATGIFLFCGFVPVDAATEVNRFDFSVSVNAMGGFGKVGPTYMPNGSSANYIQVDLKADNGDKYDVNYYYAPPAATTSIVVLGAKKGIEAKGKRKTIYFIPPTGDCPSGTSSDCIKVPAIGTGYNAVTDNNNACSGSTWLYGLSFNNGSLFGGTVKISGTMKFMNY